jgi:hypothetical protein
MVTGRGRLRRLFLEIGNQVVRRTEVVIQARGIFVQKIAIIACGQVCVISAILHARSCGLVARAVLFILAAQLEQSQQDLVTLRLQFGNRARADLGMNAVDERLLHFGRQYRLPENLPPRRHGAGELLEEVLDAALATAQMIEHQVAHDAPAQARAPAQGGVDVRSADDAFGNEVINLPRERRLQTIGDVPGHLLSQPDGLLTQPGVELCGALNRGFRGLRAADNLDERNQVRRVERMADDAALGVRGLAIPSFFEIKESGGVRTLSEKNLIVIF